jgi:hypothetical protein
MGQFPGMNPYLESDHLWPTFHHALVTELNRSLAPQLSNRYRSDIGVRGYTVTDSPAPPVEQQSRHEEYIEVCEQDHGQLVTLLDIVSPANKTTGSGRQAYLETRRAAREAGANVVEIDLVLQGKALPDYDRKGLPDWDYAVTVTRSTHRDRFEIYTATLQKRLPRFRLPLSKNDRDVVLDLTSAFSRTFEDGGFADRIDYDHGPPAEVISTYAYRLWEREGRPHGRDQAHWYKAITVLRGETQGSTISE